MLYVILRGHWCNIIVVNVHAPCEDNSDEVKDSFCEELGQCFSTGGTHTTGGARRVIWWYMRILNYLFHNLIFKMLSALLISFSIYLNVKKRIYKV
jgi:hypothetical protein